MRESPDVVSCFFDGDVSQRCGWDLVSMWEFEVGADAQQVEAAILAWWRDELGAPQALTTTDMPVGGETETVWLADVDLDQTAAFIERLIAARQ
jgi:hypothetical protein